jgi:hypothetical protein
MKRKTKTKFKSKNIKNTKKIKGGAQSTSPNPYSFSEMTFTKFMYISLDALMKTVASITTLPIRNVDELIPPDLCKRFANPFVCSQSVLQYLFTGTKPDNKKVLPESDKNDCIQIDEDGNKIVSCKLTGGTRTKKNNSKSNQYGGKQYGGKQYGGKQYGGMIIGCNEDPKVESSVANNEKKEEKEKKEEEKEKKEKNKFMINYTTQNLKLLLIKLKKLNIYLRKYLCPIKKIELLIEKINDVRLLEKTLEVCKILLNNYKYNNTIGRDERLKKCDNQYETLTKREIRVQADTKHLGMLIFPKDDYDCSDCSEASLWAEALGKYYSVFSGAIKGDTNNIHYIMMNIIHDMAKLDTSHNDTILIEMTDILKNIECRSNLTQVIENRITKLNNKIEKLK